MSNRILRGGSPSTVTSKHQFTLPATVVRFHGWKPGTRLIFRVSDVATGEFVARPLDVATARHELADAVAEFQRHLADPDIPHAYLLEHARSVRGAIRRFEDE